MGYGGQQGNRVRNKSGSPGPKQTALSGCSLEGCKDGPNPFATENVKWLRNQRRTSSGARRSPNVRRRSASATRQRVRQQHVEQTVLQALERLNKRDTLELGSRQLQEVLVDLEPQRLVWFLRTVFDDKKPLQSVLARREQLLLLTTLVQQFPDAVLSSNALQDRILPTLLGALRMSDIQDTVARVCCEIFTHMCPDGDVEKFLVVCPIVVKAFLDPLVLGAGWDTLRKQRCLSVFGAVVPVLLAKAMLVDTEPRVQATMAGFVSLLCHGLAANPGLHEGLLQCLVHIASCGGDSLVPHAHRLAETCAKHLSETPSVVPAYAQPSVPAESGHGESPPRRFILTRELALVCCVCLKHLADSVAPLLAKPAHEELLKLRPTVEVALGRENLNLQRLTRGNEPLRVAITHAWQAWHVISSQAPLPRRPQSPGALSGPWQCDGAYSRQQQLRDLTQPLLENQVPDMRPGTRPSPAPVPQQHPRRQRPASAGHCGRPDIPPTLPRLALDSEVQHRASLHQPPVPAKAAASSRPRRAPAANIEVQHRASLHRPPGRAQKLSAAENATDALELRNKQLSGQVKELTTSNAALQESLRKAHAAMETAFSGMSGDRSTDREEAYDSSAEEAAASTRPLLAPAANIEAANDSEELHRKLEEEASLARAEVERLKAELASMTSEHTQHLSQQVQHLASLLQPPARAEAAASTRPLLAPAGNIEAANDGEELHRKLEAELAAMTSEHAQHLSQQVQHRAALHQPPAPVEAAASTRPPLAPAANIEARSAIARSRRRAPLSVASQGSEEEDSSHVNMDSIREPAACVRNIEVQHRVPLHQPPAPAKAAPSTLPLLAPAANIEVEAPFCDFEDHVPEPLITWTVPPDGDAPGLGAALRSLQTGAVVEAFQCVFSIGNEKTLQSVLAYLHPETVWQELPEEECKHLAHLLARVICKEPFADFSLTACEWLSVLLRWPAGQEAINMQDRAELQPSLFALSGSTGGLAGRAAASLYYCLFEETQQQS